MFYRKEEKLDNELFKNPSCEYRATPFWAWNSTLDTEELSKQIEIFKEMGFGGFHMHVRQGLETPYMDKEFMEAVGACIEKAKKEEMLAWLYDEDRWPSGCAGGQVTSDKKYRLRYLLLTRDEFEDVTEDYEVARNEGKPLYLASFTVNVDKNGYLTDYKMVDRSSKDADKLNFYCMTMPGGEPRYNFQTYSDNLSEECVNKFIELTHEKYAKEFANDFGKTVPAIFTDEPQMIYASRLESGNSRKNSILPFNLEVLQEFKAQNGYDLTQKLPELFFAGNTESCKKTKYDYYRYISEKFCFAFSDTIGKWCEKNNIMLTGHAMCEDSLYEQMIVCYESMRLYKEMQLPGIDVLFDDRCFTTALQCNSVARQYGREGMLSELYGVTGWDFDFRGHKFQGDWQACLGVTVRVPHLAWQTMKGEGKRDYPASLSYQSPWYKEYKYLEDHYARINTALSRGIADVKVAVLHPIESVWLDIASDAETAPLVKEIDERFHTLADWLLDSMVGFDYISQALLSDLCKEGSAPLKVGKCSYDVIIVSDCITLRQHTLDVLKEFIKKGGKVIFTGLTPTRCEGLLSNEAKELTQYGKEIVFSRNELLNELSEYKVVSLTDNRGRALEGFMHTLKTDGDRKWLFIAHSQKPELKHITSRKKSIISLKGEYTPSLYDTLSGQVKKIPYTVSDGTTKVFIDIYDYDSVLLAFDKVTEYECKNDTTEYSFEEIKTENYADHILSEPNVLLLDMAQYSVNGSPYSSCEEIMRIDDKVRAQLGLKSRRTKVVQPYVIKSVPEDNTLSLRFTINSEIYIENAFLALENSAKCSITLNDRSVENKAIGYYVDKDIHTVALGPIEKGENVLVVTMPFGLRTDLEAVYILGDFGTKCYGSHTVITDKVQRLYYGNTVPQGLCFYGGNITYKTEFELDEDADVEVEISNYSGALIKVTVDSDKSQRLIFSPYKVRFENLSKGKHSIEYLLYGNRYNTFTALHTLVADKKRIYMGPDFWRSEGNAWSYEYNFRPFGILKAPIIRKVIKK